jgi:glycolate oxidase FAD binding subunit
VAVLSDALGSPYGVSGAAWLPAEAASRTNAPVPSGQSAVLIRIEEFSPSVTYRLDRLRDQFDQPKSTILDTAASRALWKAVRDARPLAPGEAIWRVSVRPSAGPRVLEAVAPLGVSGFLDWGGGLVWLSGPAEFPVQAAIEKTVAVTGGTWTLMRAPEGFRGSVRAVPDEAPALARIRQGVKSAMDPAGILNPGRIYAGL